MAEAQLVAVLGAELREQAVSVEPLLGQQTHRAVAECDETLRWSAASTSGRGMT